MTVGNGLERLLIKTNFPKNKTIHSIVSHSKTHELFIFKFVSQTSVNQSILSIVEQAVSNVSQAKSVFPLLSNQ